MLYTKITLRRDCMALLPIRTTDLAKLLGATRARLVDDYKHDPVLVQRLYRLWMALNILRYQGHTPAEMRKLIKQTDATVTLTIPMEFNHECLDLRPVPQAKSSAP